MKSVSEFRERKRSQKKISMVTAYDAWSAKLIDATEVDCILVGDSAAMVMHGHDSTLPVSIEAMADHVAAVAKGAREKFIIGDLPFLSFRKGIRPAMEAVEMLMKAGAHSVKLEGIEGHEDVVAHILQSGVPVMGHIGLTPQSINQLGGFKVQGKNKKDSDRLLDQAKTLDELGCFGIVLECVPSAVAKKITQNVLAPTIGIGAGPDVDGQVLVLQDLLGLSVGFKPKFLRTYLDGAEQFRSALNRFSEDVVRGRFPSAEESYEIEPEGL